MIRAIAADIDGTLTDKNRVLCPASLQAVRQLNVPLVLATGNTHCFTRTVAIILGTPFLFIAENGGVVCSTNGDIEILADLQICESAYLEMSKVFPLQRHDSRYRFTDITLKRSFDVDAAARYIIERGLPVELVDTTFAVHIKDISVDKGTGLRLIARKMGIPLEEFAAIGDSSSDYPMFRLAGFKASVGNASPDLKAISDYVAKAQYGEGFAEIVEYLAEKKMV